MGDRDLLPLAVVLWIASFARLAVGSAESALDAEATVALGCVVGIPWLSFHSWRRGSRRVESPRRVHGASVLLRVRKISSQPQAR